MSHDLITRQNLEDLINPLKDDVKQILDHLEKQNGRLKHTEIDIAILKDRQPQRQAIMWGSGAGALVAILGMLFDYFRK